MNRVVVGYFLLKSMLVAASAMAGTNGGRADGAAARATVAWGDDKLPGGDSTGTFSCKMDGWLLRGRIDRGQKGLPETSGVRDWEQPECLGRFLKLYRKGKRRRWSRKVRLARQNACRCLLERILWQEDGLGNRMAAARAMRRLGCRRQRRRFTRFLNDLAERRARVPGGASCDAKWSRGLFDLLRLHLELRGFLPPRPSEQLLLAGCRTERYSFLRVVEKEAPALLAGFGEDLLEDSDLSFVARVGNGMCEAHKALPERLERILLNGSVHEKTALAVYAPVCINIFASKYPDAICQQGDARLRLVMSWTAAARRWRECSSTLADALADACPLMRIIALEALARLDRGEIEKLLAAVPERDPNEFVDRALRRLREGKGLSEDGTVELWLEPADQSGRNSSAPKASR